MVIVAGRKVLLDTNMLLAPAQFGVDIFHELRGHELLVLESGIRELRKLAQGKGRAAANAKVALQLVKSKGIKTVREVRGGDAAVLSYAAAAQCAVATNDRKLIKTLTSKGITVIRLRQKRYLAEE